MTRPCRTLWPSSAPTASHPPQTESYGKRSGRARVWRGPRRGHATTKQSDPRSICHSTHLEAPSSLSVYFLASSGYTGPTPMFRLRCGPARVSPRMHHPIEGQARTRHGASIWHLLSPSSWVFVARDRPRPEPRFNSSFHFFFLALLTGDTTGGRRFSSLPSSPEILPGGRQLYYFPSSPEILPGGGHFSSFQSSPEILSGEAPKTPHGKCGVHLFITLLSSLRPLGHGTTSRMGKDANISRPSDCRSFRSANCFILSGPPRQPSSACLFNRVLYSDERPPISTSFLDSSLTRAPTFARVRLWHGTRPRTRAVTVL